VRICIYCDHCVCLSICLSVSLSVSVWMLASISQNHCANFAKFAAAARVARDHCFVFFREHQSSTPSYTALQPLRIASFNQSRVAICRRGKHLSSSHRICHSHAVIDALPAWVCTSIRLFIFYSW